MTNRTHRPKISRVLHPAWKNFIIRNIAFHFKSDFPTESSSRTLESTHAHTLALNRNMSSFQLKLKLQKQERPHTRTAAVNALEIADFYLRLLLCTLTSFPAKISFTKALAVPASCRFCWGLSEVTSPGTVWHYRTKAPKHSCLLTQKSVKLAGCCISSRNCSKQVYFSLTLTDSFVFTYCL